ncbi:unnamed protein product [Cuscuta europaea]|uniref:WEB family protein n=2 Tax=Cuscuta europaea TaxID=41803 RepID=A0A9P0ZSK2_CUSEU|nr:unnamed protein product [Cuscuta europaea]
MSTKSKSTLPETPKSKVSPATPRGGSKVSRGASKFDAESPLQNLRSSVDKSPKPVAPKASSAERPSTKLATPPDKKPTRILKPSELQTELSLAQEDLKQAREKIASVEKDKAQALDDLKEAKKLADEANEKLREALIAQKRAEDNSEIDKFRAVEMEQAGIEAAHEKEQKWAKEIEAVRNQQALDSSSLLSITQELDLVKHELSVTIDAKNQALSRANEASKVAEIHAENIKTLTAELARVKSMVDSRSEMNLEIETLREELERTKNYELELMEKEDIIEKLKVDLEASKIAESYACNLVEEWKKTVNALELETEEAHRNERSSLEHLESSMKQLEDRNESLHKAESEIASLKEKIRSLESSIERNKGELEESEYHLKITQEEASELVRKVESLSFELNIIRDEKIQALMNEKLAAKSVEKLLEEKNRLLEDLKNSREEEEQSKRTVEDLTSALHEVSSQAREANEKLLSSQVETKEYETRIEDLKIALKNSNEKYEDMLGDAKQEIDLLTKTVDQSKQDYDILKAEQEEKERNLITKAEEASSSMEKEINTLANLLKHAQEEASNARESEANLKTSLSETEREVIYLREVLRDTTAESMRLKESLMEKETELQSILQENEELQIREAMALKKIEELSLMHEEAMARKQDGENGDLTDSEKDIDMLLPNVEQNGVPEERSTVKEEVQEKEAARGDAKDDTNGTEEFEVKESVREEKEDKGCVEEGEFERQESFQFGEKDSFPERVTEPEKESEQKEEVCEKKYDQPNGLKSSIEKHDNNVIASPGTQQSPKKKKPLLSKFGSFMKKKGTVSQK